ncbi:MAG: response regulator transcription factor [Arenicellales bacterium]
MKKILMIDDDDDLAAPLKTYFARYDLALEHANHPDTGIALLKKNHYELLILDIMLPDKDGFESCKEIRYFSDIPIIMLTARGEVTDRVVGLELGADDYVSKPFDPRELVARIHRILKRGNTMATQQTCLAFGALEINFDAQTIHLDKQALSLTGHEFTLLKLLCDAQGKIISRDSIMQAVNGIDADVYSRSVDVLVSRLRQKLKPLEPIITLRGKGYRWALKPDE